MAQSIRHSVRTSTYLSHLTGPWTLIVKGEQGREKKRLIEEFKSFSNNTLLSYNSNLLLWRKLLVWLTYPRSQSTEGNKGRNLEAGTGTEAMDECFSLLFFTLLFQPACLYNSGPPTQGNTALFIG